jgi:hypothetical protein
MAVEQRETLLCTGAMVKDLNILQDFDTRYEEAYSAWDGFYALAARDLRFFLGDQWSEEEKRQLFQEGRSQFVFNRARRNINMVLGYQIKNRLSSVAVPIENSDQKTADQLSQLLLYVMNYGNGYKTISDCFGGALKTGWNLMSIWKDYRDDPVNGDIKFGREPFNGFILDPYLTKRDLTDCSYILRRKYLTPEHVASLLPGEERNVKQLYKLGSSRDDKFTWLPYQREATTQEMMAYNEMYIQKWKNIPMLVDMETGETLEFEVKQDEIKMFLDKYPQLRVVKRPKRYVEMHVIVNNEVMKKEINPFGLDEYPFALSTAIFEPESDQWGLKVQSLMRCMIDPQREGNQRRSQMSDILNSQINSGWLADENSVINPRSLFQSSQGKVIWRREGSQPGAVEKIQPAQVPPSMFQLQELYDRDMAEIAGINEASFGEPANAGESGVMMMLRQSASVVNLQDIFDNLRDMQKDISKKAIKIIQTWTPEKVKRIINKEPTQEFYNSEFSKYDVTVQEGILTDTQRQMNFRQMVDIYQLTGGPQGSPITPQMLYEAAPLQGKSEINEKIQANQEQAQQQAQQQAQVQQQLLKTQSESMQAKAISDVALSKERFTRAVANNSLSDERAAKAVEDRTDAALNRIKAVQEMQSIDDDRLIKYLGIIKQLEELSRRDEEEIKESDVAIASKGQEIGDVLSGANPSQQSMPQAESLQGQQQPSPMEM